MNQRKKHVEETIRALKQTQTIFNRLRRGDRWYQQLLQQINRELAPQSVNNVKNILHRKGSEDKQDKKFNILANYINGQLRLRDELMEATSLSLKNVLAALDGLNKTHADYNRVLQFLGDPANYDIRRLAAEKNLINNLDKNLYNVLFRFFLNNAAFKSLLTNQTQDRIVGQLLKKVKDAKAGFSRQQAAIARQLGWDGEEAFPLTQQSRRTAVNNAYRRKALELHPDRGGDAQLFKKYNHVKSRLLGLDD